LRLMPALNISEDEVALALQLLHEALRQATE
jgi:4-aminobutyrate aminotransferase-like enzyme